MYDITREIITEDMPILWWAIEILSFAWGILKWVIGLGILILIIALVSKNSRR